MKHLIFIFLTSLIPIFCFTQNQPQIDSLKALLETNLSDKEKVDVWNLIAREYADIDLEAVLKPMVVF